MTASCGKRQNLNSKICSCRCSFLFITITLTETSTGLVYALMGIRKTASVFANIFVKRFVFVNITKTRQVRIIQASTSHIPTKNKLSCSLLSSNKNATLRSPLSSFNIPFLFGREQTLNSKHFPHNHLYYPIHILKNYLTT